MVSFEEIQAAYYMVAATGVLVAAVYYVMNLSLEKVPEIGSEDPAAEPRD